MTGKLGPAWVGAWHGAWYLVVGKLGRAWHGMVRGVGGGGGGDVGWCSVGLE